ncbi:hypothetical protein RUM44_008376 [Polyplax serrata]|uniref:Synaptic plasticity regulator PANTS n=1 Tax=Polyplax serrata TaxID=468196 RepID=A0ABR1B832_POLSC
MSSSNEIKDLNANRQEFVNNYCTIRDCFYYKEDYKECKSLKGRFQQYFIFGEMVDCSPYKMKWKLCNKCAYGNEEACDELIREENKLREKRLKTALQNDVWKKRDGPPADWNKELPDWAKEKLKVSYLNVANQSCVIL